MKSAFRQGPAVSQQGVSPFTRTDTHLPMKVHPVISAQAHLRQFGEAGIASQGLEPGREWRSPAGEDPLRRLKASAVSSDLFPQPERRCL
jgi:hypothetical protein